MKRPVSPPRGMRDILPQETAIRDHVSSVILATYRQFGFQHIETPALESIGLLLGSDAGENEKLIFKVLKRGAKLAGADGGAVDGLVDLGLRFDLTVPLARFYAANRGHLPRAFKAIQLGPVWRAERPGRGRFRQFTQCDIDVIGMGSVLCEAELLAATSAALLAVGLEGFVIRINDRRLLTAIAAQCGFAEDQWGAVFISLDKLDKIGLDGVSRELRDAGQPAAAIEKLMTFLASLEENISPGMADAAPEAAAELNQVIEAVESAADGRYSIRFDPTLVRGMGYYTGQIFEIGYRDYPFSIAGGGRYDQMIGAMIGVEVPACGFSIGFERLITIIQEEGMAGPDERRRLALIVEADVGAGRAITASAAQRAAGYDVSLVPRAGKFGRQLAGLVDEGFSHFSRLRDDTDDLVIEALHRNSA